jgi:membrane protein DedA with SNARE-associated domain
VTELVNTLIHWVNQFGFLAIFVLMTFESACVPVPSEPVMVYGGYLVFTGHMTFPEAALAGTLGNILGSLIAYWIGFRGSPWVAAVVERRGLTALKIRKADGFFHRWGEPSVLIGRMVPVVRTFISLPAGIARMDWRKFLAFTALGSLPWNVGLVWVGLKAGQHWERALAWLHQVDYVVVGLGALAVLGLAAWWLAMRVRRSGSPEA